MNLLRLGRLAGTNHVGVRPRRIPQRPVRHHPPPDCRAMGPGTATGTGNTVSLDVCDVFRSEPWLHERRETSPRGSFPAWADGLWRDHNRRLSRGRGTRLLLAQALRLGAPSRNWLPLRTSEQRSQPATACPLGHRSSHQRRGQLTVALGVTQAPRWRSCCGCSSAQRQVGASHIRASGRRGLADYQHVCLVDEDFRTAPANRASAAAEPTPRRAVSRVSAGLQAGKQQPSRPSSDCRSPAQTSRHLEG